MGLGGLFYIFFLVLQTNKYGSFVQWVLSHTFSLSLFNNFFNMLNFTSISQTIKYFWMSRLLVIIRFVVLMFVSRWRNDLHVTADCLSNVYVVLLFAWLWLLLVAAAAHTRFRSVRIVMWNWGQVCEWLAWVYGRTGRSSQPVSQLAGWHATDNLLRLRSFVRLFVSLVVGSLVRWFGDVFGLGFGYSFILARSIHIVWVEV